MKITFFEPRGELRPYIQSLWVFESPYGMPSEERSLAAPNGCAKLIIPYANSLESIANGRSQISREHGLYFVGNQESSTLVQSSPQDTGFIGIEFYPHGAFPLFGISMHETVNGLYEAEAIFDKWGKEVRQSISSIGNVDEKVQFVQTQLASILKDRLRNPLVEFCVNSLKNSHGLLSIKELEVKTGFTRQYLNQLFRRHVGLSPKSLSRMYRFQRFYKLWAVGTPYEVLKDELYDYYYDQGHFIKEFKQLTGYAPRQFAKEVPNEFGRRLLSK